MKNTRISICSIKNIAALFEQRIHLLKIKLSNDSMSLLEVNCIKVTTLRSKSYDLVVEPSAHDQKVVGLIPSNPKLVGSGVKAMPG